MQAARRAAGTLGLRASGRSWAEIATELHGNADALRMKYTRALLRVMRELGIEE